MKVGWLIDADMFDGYREELVAAIHDQGHDAKLIHAPSPPFRWDDVGCFYRETFSKDACVIAHGDIALMNRIRQKRRWIPGAFCTAENFTWFSYAFYYGKYLVVSSPKSILSEWRFVIADGKVVTGCQYKDGDDLDYRPEYDRNAFELAESIADIDYQPDPVWVMDIFQISDGSYHLLEIGGFSFSDLYACNKREVVSAVSAVAKAVWEEQSA